MAKTNLSGASFVKRGYGQVEPNHLSAQRTGQIYAQLPAAKDITLLQNGQFVKYDYSKNEVNFTGKGEWMLVFNEVKLYRDYEDYNDFAMKKDDYVARVYSPIDGSDPKVVNARNYKDVAKASEYDPSSTNDPFAIEQFKSPALMAEKTNMVPRVFKTNVGDIFTTNLVNMTAPTVGTILTPNATTGILEEDSDESEAMLWQVVKVYTLPDRQPAVKIMRIA